MIDKSKLRVATVLVAFLACGTAAAQPQRDAFIAAIEDAAVPDTSRIDTGLFAVTDDNPSILWRDPAQRRELLAVAFMSDEAYMRFYSSGRGTTPPNRPVVWVTIAPQVREFCRSQYAGTEDMALRLKQYLGLDPTRPYERFVEMWVNRDDVFRPCPDPEPTDSQCELTVSSHGQVPRLSNYPDFFAQLYVGAYQVNGAPWTRLGYTYDWADPSRPVGASEFMLAPSSAYEVHSTSSIEEYCQP